MQNFINIIINENCLTGLDKIPSDSIDCCITSPPYWGLRDYGTATWVGGDSNCPHFREEKNNNPDHEVQTRHKVDSGVGDAIFKKECGKCGAIRVDDQIGLEESPEEYVEKLSFIFEKVRRVLKPEGTLWLNLGDSYTSAKSRYSTKPQSIENSNNGDAKYGQMMQEGKPDLYNHPFLKDKDLVGIPWKVAFELQKRGWWLRQDIIWSKPNPMPESVTDRCTKAHEYIFLLSKSARYYFDYQAIQEEANYDGRKDIIMKGSPKYEDSVVPGKDEHTMAARSHTRWKFKSKSTFGSRGGQMDKLHSGNEYQPQLNEEMVAVRNKRSVWTVNTKPYHGAHFASFPELLIKDCILAGCPEEGTILDIFMGAGTTAVVARKLHRNYLGFELNPEYVSIANNRLQQELGMFL